MSSDPKNIAKAVALKQIYSTPKPAIDMESGEPIPPTAPNDYETENILHQASMYEAAGVGLSRSEMYGVMLCLKKLGENPDNNIDTVRFFGEPRRSSGARYHRVTTFGVYAPSSPG